MSETVTFKKKGSIDLEVECSDCGNILSIDWDSSREVISVDICENCKGDDSL